MTGFLTRDIVVNYGPRGEDVRPSAEVGVASRSLPVKRAIFHATSDWLFACNSLRLYDAYRVKNKKWRPDNMSYELPYFPLFHFRLLSPPFSPLAIQQELSKMASLYTSGFCGFNETSRAIVLNVLPHAP